MAQQGKSDELITIQELAVSNACEIAALIAVLERKGILTQQEVLDKIARLRAKTPRVRQLAPSIERLERLERDAVRDQVRLMCEQLDWRGSGCP